MAFQSEKNQFEKVYGRVFLSSNVHYEEQQCKHDSEYHEFKAMQAWLFQTGFSHFEKP